MMRQEVLTLVKKEKLEAEDRKRLLQLLSQAIKENKIKTAKIISRKLFKNLSSEKVKKIVQKELKIFDPNTELKFERFLELLSYLSKKD